MLHSSVKAMVCSHCPAQCKVRLYRFEVDLTSVSYYCFIDLVVGTYPVMFMFIVTKKSDHYIAYNEYIN